MNPAKARRLSSIEPLESRIAPARVILAGVPNSLPGNDVDYNDSIPADDAIIVNIKNAPASDQIAQALGGASAPADTYYMRMYVGDVLKLFTATNGLTDPFYTQIHGNSVIFLRDVNGDNEVQPNEIMGISLGANAGVDIKGGVPGDIVTNLDEKGTVNTADDTLVMNGLVSSKQNIGSLSVSATVGGSILAGGKITNTVVFGNVGNVLAGSATDGTPFDFFPGVSNGKGTIVYPTAGIQAGASISNLVVDKVAGRVEAGKGGPGFAGGSLMNVQVTDDFDGFVLKAGNGGDAIGGRPTGGKGGSISRVYISGVDDPTAHDLVQIHAGDGGSAAAFLRGGTGGAIDTVFVGSSLIGKGVFPSASLLQDNVDIAGGTGGAGKIGGTGGAVSNIDVKTSTPDGPGRELTVSAGNGGSAAVPGGQLAGVGGDVKSVKVRNGDPGLLGLSGILVKAGDGGLASGGASGNKGGAITNAAVLGFDVSVLAGIGSDGRVGGNGGMLKGLTAEEADGILMRIADFESGHGGQGLAGSGGNGGALDTIGIVNSDVSSLAVLAGSGGASVGGRGGKGGAVSNLDLVDGGGAGVLGVFNLSSGSGGDGTRGGGAAGTLSTVKYTGIDTTIAVTSGHGGSAVGAGASGGGGKAGKISGLALATVGSLAGSIPGGSIVGGKGGNAAGGRAAGGAGGDVSNANIDAAGAVSVIAGDGGDGSGSAPGKGGSILLTGAFGESGDGQLIAGNAGANGAAPAAGGAIAGTSISQRSSLFASGMLTIRAGNGTQGGAGGAIKFVGYGSSSSTLVPTPIGQILIKAGDGSAGPVAAGAGGSITSLSGSAASIDGTHPGPFDTTIAAGDGGGSPRVSAAGGSISDIEIQRGGNAGGVLTVKAGDAGDSAGAAGGAAGGSVSLVSITDIDPGNILRSIAAGDGGNARGTGGKGGSLTDINVFGHDIGVRSGQAFGYATMGGLFAGAGGSGAKTGRAGSVMHVTAPMIAAIVAGRDAAPKAADTVSFIYIGTPANLLVISSGNVNADGSFIDAGALPPGVSPDKAYQAATLVGAVVNPFVPGANKFHFIDANGDGIFEAGEVAIDGLIMAKTYKPDTTNFTPEARLTGGQFYDFDNTY